MDKWFKDILPDKDPYHNRGRDQMRKKGVRNSSACDKTDCHDITEILLRVALSIISLTPIMSKDGILYYLIFNPWLWPSALFNKANNIHICEFLCHND